MLQAIWDLLRLFFLILGIVIMEAVERLIKAVRSRL
jgi:hypothetical protein